MIFIFCLLRGVDRLLLSAINCLILFLKSTSCSPSLSVCPSESESRRCIAEVLTPDRSFVCCVFISSPFLLTDKFLNQMLSIVIISSPMSALMLSCSFWRKHIKISLEGIVLILSMINASVKSVTDSYCSPSRMCMCVRWLPLCPPYLSD